MKMSYLTLSFLHIYWHAHILCFVFLVHTGRLCVLRDGYARNNAVTQIYLKEKKNKQEKVTTNFRTRHQAGSESVAHFVQIHPTELEIFHYMRENSGLLAVPEKMSGDHKSQLSLETMDIKKTSQQSI